MIRSSSLCENVFETPYTVVHKFCMAEPSINDVPKILKALMEGEKKQGRLAKLLKTSQTQVSRWLKGNRPNGTSFSNILALARERGLIDDVRSEDVAESIDVGPQRTISVKGYVGAGSESFVYNVANAGELDTIIASDRDTDQTVALRIVGFSLGKFFNSWYVTYDDVRSPVTDDLINELCVVGLDDDRVFVKKIRRHGRTKRFDLLSNSESEPIIENVAIEWAAKVKDLRQG